MSKGMLTEENLDRVRSLNAIAAGRGQSLAQMALAWCLRDPRMTSVMIGASSVAQLEDNIGALDNLSFTDAETGRHRSALGVRCRHQPLGAVQRRVTRDGVAPGLVLSVWERSPGAASSAPAIRIRRSYAALAAAPNSVSVPSNNTSDTCVSRIAVTPVVGSLNHEVP